jgi:hypothetical protein
LFPPYGVTTFENDEQNVRWCKVTKGTAGEFCFDKRFMEKQVIRKPRQDKIRWIVNINDEGLITKE